MISDQGRLHSRLLPRLAILWLQSYCRSDRPEPVLGRFLQIGRIGHLLRAVGHEWQVQIWITHFLSSPCFISLVYSSESIHTFFEVESEVLEHARIAKLKNESKTSVQGCFYCFNSSSSTKNARTRLKKVFKDKWWQWWSVCVLGFNICMCIFPVVFTFIFHSPTIVIKLILILLNAKKY